MSFDLTDQDRAAWRAVQFDSSSQRAAILAHALQKTLAGKMEAEFHQLHHRDQSYCSECQTVSLSHRHNWTEADWMAAAKKELEKV